MKKALNSIKSVAMTALVILLMSTTFAAIFAMLPILVWFPRVITDGIIKYMNWVVDLAKSL